MAEPVPILCLMNMDKVDYFAAPISDDDFDFTLSVLSVDLQKLQNVVNPKITVSQHTDLVRTTQM